MKKNDVKIGWWVIDCCCIDAHKIETEEELKEVKDDFDLWGLTFDVVPTKQDVINNYCSCDGKCFLLDEKKDK